jgi:SHS family lactate transporter-like MFS transporter
MSSLLASGSNTILVRIATRFPEDPDPRSSLPTRNDFSIPIAAFAGCAFVYVIVMAVLGPENRGRDMVTDDDSDSEPDREEGEIRGTANDVPMIS